MPPHCSYFCFVQPNNECLEVQSSEVSIALKIHTEYKYILVKAYGKPQIRWDIVSEILEMG